MSEYIRECVCVVRIENMHNKRLYKHLRLCGSGAVNTHHHHLSSTRSLATHDDASAGQVLQTEALQARDPEGLGGGGRDAGGGDDARGGHGLFPVPAGRLGRDEAAVHRGRAGDVGPSGIPMTTAHSIA